jgi:glycosyltransferase involved in cell wall biosynthesis
VRRDWEFRYLSAYDHVGGLEHVPVLGDVVAALRLARQAVRSDADIVVVHGADYVWAVRAARRLFKKRFALVSVWHGDGPRAARMSRPPGTLAARLLARYLWVVCGLALGADAHIAVHEHIVEEMRQEWGFTGRVVVCHNALEHALRGQLGQAAPRPHHGFVCLWVGQISYRKGLDIALAACQAAREHIPSLRLVVAGVRPGPAVPTWVDVRGRVEPAEALALYGDADVLVFPSRYEGFAVVLLEAMGAGLPIVCSRDFGEGILVDGRNGILIRGFDAAGYAHAIRALHDDARVRQRMRSVNSQDVRRFDWSRTAAAYAEVFDALLEVEGVPRQVQRAARSGSVASVR